MISYFIRNKKENKIAIGLIIGFIIFYIALNLPIVRTVNSLGESVNPFYTENFKLNLFNLDPLLYYYDGPTNVIHPLFSLISETIGRLFSIFGGNYGVLILQSIIGASTVGLIFLIIRNELESNILSCLTAILYGICSYQIVTTFIPDTYVYAQIVIVLSICYFQYAIKSGKRDLITIAILGVLNFGITATNIVPYIINTIIAKNEKILVYLKKLGISLVLFLGGVFFLTYIQSDINNGLSWANTAGNIYNNLDSLFTDTFELGRHFNIIKYMLIAPIVTPIIFLIDSTQMAFVTNAYIPLNNIIEIIIIIIGIAVFAGIVINIKNKITWVFLTYIMFAFVLHVIVGFGLLNFQYDMYLYAGNYIAVIILLFGMAFSKIKNEKLIKVVVVFLVLLCSIILYFNVTRNFEMINVINNAYGITK